MIIYTNTVYLLESKISNSFHQPSGFNTSSSTFTKPWFLAARSKAPRSFIECSTAATNEGLELGEKNVVKPHYIRSLGTSNPHRRTVFWPYKPNENSFKRLNNLFHCMRNSFTGFGVAWGNCTCYRVIHKEVSHK